MQATKGHLQIYKDETDKDIQTLSENIQIPLLPASLYAAEMKKVIGLNYNASVYKTGKKVCERLIGYYVKPMKDASAQTGTLAELTIGYERQIRELEKEVVFQTKVNE